MSACMKKIGSPDLLILFTGTVSHKMIKCALNDIKGKKHISRAHLKNKVKKARPCKGGPIFFKEWS